MAARTGAGDTLRAAWQEASVVFMEETKDRSKKPIRHVAVLVGVAVVAHHHQASPPPRLPPTRPIRWW